MRATRHSRRQSRRRSSEDKPVRDGSGVEGEIARENEAQSATIVRTDLGGYRLLRTIGASTHCTVYLASGDEGRGVVKAYNRESDRTRIAQEIACLAAVSSQHVVELIDVFASQAHPTCLILERLEGPNLASWLSDREIVELGEAVTIGVSVLRAVHAVHSVGWAHGDVSAASLRLDASGCPVLLGFSAAAPITTDRADADWSNAVAIMEAVLSAAEDVDSERLITVSNALRDLRRRAGGEATAVTRAEAAFFGLGPASPVSMAQPVVSSVGERRHERTRHSESGGAERPSLGADRGTERLATAVLSLMENGARSSIAEHVRKLVVGRRRPLLVAVGVAVAITTTALLVMPHSPAGHAQTSDGTPTKMESSQRPKAAAPLSVGPTPTASDAALASPTAKVNGAQADDPVTAVSRLLAVRRACLVSKHDGCLTDADQIDSPILASDAALMANGAEISDAPDPSALSLVESMGDAAVVAVTPNVAETTKPASVLLIRTEAGWRLRTFYEN